MSFHCGRVGLNSTKPKPKAQTQTQTQMQTQIEEEEETKGRGEKQEGAERREHRAMQPHNCSMLLLLPHGHDHKMAAPMLYTIPPPPSLYTVCPSHTRSTIKRAGHNRHLFSAFVCGSLFRFPFFAPHLYLYL